MGLASLDQKKKNDLLVVIVRLKVKIITMYMIPIAKASINMDFTLFSRKYNMKVNLKSLIHFTICIVSV